MIYASQSELDAAVAKWQKILRLQDWDLTVELATGADLDSVGGCNAAENMQMARIRVLRQEDWRGNTKGSWCVTDIRDMEVDLVHEMIHCLMRLIEPKTRDSVEWNLYERFVESLAGTLVNLDRM